MKTPIKIGKCLQSVAPKIAQPTIIITVFGTEIRFIWLSNRIISFTCINTQSICVLVNTYNIENIVNVLPKRSDYRK